MQLDQTQWLSSAELVELQFRQLQIVFEHAYRTIPLYREHFDSVGLRLNRALSREGWKNLPTITRQDVQVAGPAMQSGQLDASHGKTRRSVMTGSNRRPIMTISTGHVNLF